MILSDQSQIYYSKMSHSTVQKMHVSVGNKSTATHKKKGITTVFPYFMAVKLQNNTLIHLSLNSADQCKIFRSHSGAHEADPTTNTL